MEAKLIKDHNNYHLVNDDQFVIGTTDESILSCTDNYKLSLKNCQEIELGYDLDELARQEAEKIHIKSSHEDWDIWEELVRDDARSIRIGMKKIIEIIGDKKFSSRNMLKAFITGVFTDETSDYDFEFTELMQDLQQTEWDVEIEMICPHPMDTYRCGIQYGCDGDGCNHPNQVPYLDANGCLILKRKI